MKTVLVNSIILDGSKDMRPINDKKIFINDGKIVKITGYEEKNEDYQVVDLKEQYVMPGLINLHVHLPASGKPQKRKINAVKMVKLITCNNLLKRIGKKICLKYAKMELLSGVTTIRTVGGIQNFDTSVRDLINSKRALGPRILASDMAISVPNGHMAKSLAYEATSSDDMKKYIDKIAIAKPDLIKLMITGGVLDAKKKGEPGELKMRPELVKAGCDYAHQLGFKVAAHVESPEGVKVALENGVDTIEHGARPNEKIINLFKQKKAALVATFSPALPYALFDRSISKINDMEQTNGKIVFDGIVECAKACLENNVEVGLGTDTGCPYTTHYNMWRELELFHDYCHVTNAFALYTATLLNAKIAGIDDKTGSISEGKSADLIVTNHNPLENLRALEKVEMVIVKGRIINNPHVNKIKKVEMELDKLFK